MRRDDWPEEFELAERRVVPWSCPNCQQKTLTVSPGTVHVYEGIESQNAGYHEAWDPEWTDRRFVCMLSCRCGEWIAVAGKQHVEQVFFASELSESNVHYLDISVPRFFQPPLRVINISEAVPTEVREQVERSFSAFWSDLESCANRVRASVEKLLDHLGIKKTAIQNGQRRPLSLHSRIQLSATCGNAFANELMAIKWLGNAGAHSSAITREDILDAYEIIEHVLREMYDQPGKRIARIAKTINKAKKPRSVTHRTRRRT
ncbi:MAG: hypothetical protein DMF56_11890 [Acidobacteria bacterium]|nr:MAG: hypothetical protein DMF56_11890 [Acidobacteriota bacterium]